MATICCASLRVSSRSGRNRDSGSSRFLKGSRSIIIYFLVCLDSLLLAHICSLCTVPRLIMYYVTYPILCMRYYVFDLTHQHSLPLTISLFSYLHIVTFRLQFLLRCTLPFGDPANALAGVWFHSIQSEHNANAALLLWYTLVTGREQLAVALFSYGYLFKLDHISKYPTICYSYLVIIN